MTAVGAPQTRPWRLLAPALVMLALLAPNLGWIWQAWTSSPLDAWGWAFLLLGMLWWLLVLDLVPPAAPKRVLDPAGWSPLALFAVAGVLGLVLDVRVAQAAAALGIGWAAAWLLLGGRLALLLAPALVLGLLALPTTGYLLQLGWTAAVGWLAPAAGLAAGAAGVMLLKAGVALTALAAGLLLGGLARRGRLPALRAATTAYAAAAAVAMLGLVAALNPPGFGPALLLAEDEWAFGPWLGAEIPVSPAERRLFADSRKLSKRLYSTRDGQRVSVLLVESDDVHDLHTPEYCLSGSGWSLLRDAPLTAADGPALAFGDAIPAAGALTAVRGGQRLAGVYWFGSDTRSTDDLAGLRLQRRLSDGPWRMILVTAVGDGDQRPEPALRRFVRDAPWLAGES
ncbi:hypothetical protein CKO31_07510 [Thiohalocapsa halophila]|uniref:Methanolan biosynthesis EpsI domain-containing protein n=1 Tax=Thiohalocapsa halophila TaxID=69359 RepID=A0ABS1CFC3_9GAMM|nr:exosortase-associated EpsI family protein [Thiohalocapsa halophila]MBK1630593.1 hypothetical protein [Thiohalocapsa halophila]